MLQVQVSGRISAVAFYRRKAILFRVLPSKNMKPLLIPWLSCKQHETGETVRGVPFFFSPLLSLLTQNREHIPLSQGHHDEGGGEGGRGREKKTPGEQNMAATPPTTHSFPFTLAFLFVQSFPSFFRASVRLSRSPAFFSTFVSYSLSRSFFLCLHWGHVLHINNLGYDKRLSNDSPVRDCKTTHSSLNHQPLNPQTYDQDLISWVMMALKGGIIYI